MRFRRLPVFILMLLITATDLVSVCEMSSIHVLKYDLQTLTVYHHHIICCTTKPFLFSLKLSSCQTLLVLLLQ